MFWQIVVNSLFVNLKLIKEFSKHEASNFRFFHPNTELVRSKLDLVTKNE